MSNSSSTINPDDVAARHNAIFGRPPRLEPVRDLTDEQRELLGPPPGFEKYIGRSPGNANASQGALVYTIMAHNPGLLRQFRTMMPFFMLEGTLAPRDRELAILRAAWMRQIPFVWGEHVEIGKKIGMTTEDMEWLIEGSTAAGWNGHDRAVVSAAEELVNDAMICGTTWETLAKSLSEAQLVELPLLVGQYLLMGYYQNSVGLPLWEGNKGLSAR